MSQSKVQTREKIVSLLVWTIGFATFIPFGLFIIIYTLLFDPKHIDPFLKAGCRFVMKAMFINIKVSGLEHVDPTKTYIFMANHVNLFDGLVLYGHIPNFVRGVELETHFNWPFWGLIVKRIGNIPISRAGGRQALQSLDQAKQRIADGTSIIILPEGTRTLTGELGEFKRGPFILAKGAGADIVPMAMINAYRIKRKGSSIIHPGTMELRFGAPIPYQELKSLNTREMQRVVETRIGGLLGE